MSSIITKNLKILLAQQVKYLTDVNANLSLPEADRTFLYAILGKQKPWNSGTEVAPTPGSTDFELENIYKRGIYSKQVEYNNSSPVVPRIDWTSGTVYNTYESPTNFYVLTSKFQVFKCLDNNNGTASTAEPELTLSSTSLEEPYLKTSDGYKWKYLYTLSSLQRQKFLTPEWMPVSYNKFVQASAVGGAIDIVNITNSGNNYIDGATQGIINVIGDGTGAILKANVVSGQVTDIVIQNRGSGYTTANLVFSDVSGGTGSGAAATVKIAPYDGHGFYPELEIGTGSVMFNVEFDGGENGLFPSENDYREVAVVVNPDESSTGLKASGPSYTLYTKIKTSPGLGDFSNDEIVYQGVTYADATFTAEVISFDEIQNVLYVNNVFGTLNNNQAIKGLQSGSIRVATSSTAPTLKLYSGKVLYISDKLPVSRDPDQVDRIRFILSF